jgi:hypothetical protein
MKLCECPECECWAHAENGSDICMACRAGYHTDEE